MFRTPNRNTAIVLVSCYMFSTYRTRLFLIGYEGVETRVESNGVEPRYTNEFSLLAVSYHTRLISKYNRKILYKHFLIKTIGFNVIRAIVKQTRK
jgi:hypothetical protein